MPSKRNFIIVIKFRYTHALLRIASYKAWYYSYFSMIFYFNLFVLGEKTENWLTSWKVNPCTQNGFSIFVSNDQISCLNYLFAVIYFIGVISASCDWYFCNIFYNIKKYNICETWINKDWLELRLALVLSHVYESFCNIYTTVPMINCFQWLAYTKNRPRKNSFVTSTTRIRFKYIGY